MNYSKQLSLQEEYRVNLEKIKNLENYYKVIHISDPAEAVEVQGEIKEIVLMNKNILEKMERDWNNRCSMERVIQGFRILGAGTNL